MKLKGTTKSKLNLSIDIVMFLLLVTMAGIGFLMKYVVVSGEERNVIYGNQTELEFFGLTRHQWGSIHLIISIIFLVLLSLHIILHWKLIVSIFNSMFTSWYLKYALAGFICIFGLTGLISPFLLNPEKVPFEPKYRNRLFSTTAPDDNLEESMDKKAVVGPKYRNRSDYIQPSENKLLETTDREASPVQQTDEPQKTSSPSIAEESPGITTHEDHHNPEYNEFEVYGYHTLQYISDRYSIPVSVIARDINIPENLAGQRLSWLRKQYGFTMTDVRESIYNYKKNKK